MKNALGLPFAALILTGCGAMTGVAPVMNKSGPTAKINLSGPANAFFTDEQAASSDRTNPDKARVMAQSGFALVRSNCSDFFDKAGTSQQWLLFSRDTVAAVGTIAAGVLALKGGHANAAGTIALVTNATFTGMDIYSRNFLFAADNVSAVKELVIRALDTHSQAVDPANIQTYSDAGNAVYDNQHYCSPMKISALARDAIQRGTVVALAPVDERADPNAFVDEKIYEALGALLNPPGALNVNQTVALWWLFKHDSTRTERAQDIWPKLAGIDPAKLPIDANGDVVAGFDKNRLVQLLNGLSAPTKASFRKQIEAAKNRIVPQGGGTLPPGGSMPVPRPPLGDFVQPRVERRTTTRVTVGIY